MAQVPPSAPQGAAPDDSQGPGPQDPSQGDGAGQDMGQMIQQVGGGLMALADAAGKSQMPDEAKQAIQASAQAFMQFVQIVSGKGGGAEDQGPQKQAPSGNVPMDAGGGDVRQAL